ncbi:unnamed protein product [Knipowitschia caucasica]
MSMLQAELERNRSAILKEINASLFPLNATLDDVSKKLDAYEPRLTDMEAGLSDHSDRLDHLERRVGILEKEKSELQAKTEDLENRSRRNNLRIIGLPENSEGRDATAFMSQFFVEVLQDPSFTRPPELDRAHRALRAKPADNEKPRPMLVRFLRFQEKERVLAIARKKGQLLYSGDKIFIFPDLSAELTKKRAAFNPVKSKLYQRGVKFFLRYPAVLCVTYEQMDYKFESVAAAEDFYKQHLSGDA